MSLQPRAFSDLAAVAHDGHNIRERENLADLVSDQNDAEHALRRHLPQRPQYEIGFVWGEHGSRLIEDEEPAPEVKVLEDLELLLLSCGKREGGSLGIKDKRHRSLERVDTVTFGFPVDNGRQIGSPKHKIFGNAHLRHQREMLIDQAHSESMRLLRMLHGMRRAVDDDLARVRAMITDDAFGQRALAGTVFADHGVEASRSKLHPDVIERPHRAEALAQPARLDEGNHFTIAPPSLPGLTRQSIALTKERLLLRWMRGSIPGSSPGTRMTRLRTTRGIIC